MVFHPQALDEGKTVWRQHDLVKVVWNTIYDTTCRCASSMNLCIKILLICTVCKPKFQNQLAIHHHSPMAQPMFNSLLASSNFRNGTSFLLTRLRPMFLSQATHGATAFVEWQRVRGIAETPLFDVRRCGLSSGASKLEDPAITPSSCISYCWVRHGIWINMNQRSRLQFQLGTGANP